MIIDLYLPLDNWQVLPLHESMVGCYSPASRSIVSMTIPPISPYLCLYPAYRPTFHTRKP